MELLHISSWMKASPHLPSDICKELALRHVGGESLPESEGDHRHDGQAVLQGQLHEALARLEVHHHLIRPTVTMIMVNYTHYSFKEYLSMRVTSWTPPGHTTGL